MQTADIGWLWDMACSERACRQGLRPPCRQQLKYERSIASHTDDHSNALWHTLGSFAAEQQPQETPLHTTQHNTHRKRVQKVNMCCDTAWVTHQSSPAAAGLILWEVAAHLRMPCQVVMVVPVLWEHKLLPLSGPPCLFSRVKHAVGQCLQPAFTVCSSCFSTITCLDSAGGRCLHYHHAPTESVQPLGLWHATQVDHPQRPAHKTNLAPEACHLWHPGLRRCCTTSQVSDGSGTDQGVY